MSVGFDVEVPERLRGLPRDARGYIVPYFVSIVNGVPDFRVADFDKWRRCVLEKRCWICGQGPIGVHKVFVIGPMCAINRVSSEPPSHRECALYAVRVCPFMARPEVERRYDNLPTEAVDAGGHALGRNPGVTMLWTTPDYSLFTDANNKPLISVGKPSKVEFYCRGRLATPEEVKASVQEGLPQLAVAAQLEGPTAVAALAKTLLRARAVLPPGTIDRIE